MNTSLKNDIKAQQESILISFIKDLNTLSSKKEITTSLLNVLGLLIRSKFISFVEKESVSLRVVCKTGDDSDIRSAFTPKMCNEIYDWVIKQKESVTLKMSEKGNFIFVPIIDVDKNSAIEHGMLVIQPENIKFEFHQELKASIDIISKLSGLSMTKSLRINESEKHVKLLEQIKAESQFTAKLQRTMSGSETSKKLLFSVIEDEGIGFNGNVWWVSDIGADISLVLMAQVLCKGSPSAMLSGYLLGEMSSLKTRAEICLKPEEVLKYLNQQLNSIYVSTGITVNAWYGVFNVAAKNVRFANANHPVPFLIGPEQQVSNLFSSVDTSQPLGVNINSVFKESYSNISSGSKMVICTSEVLEQAAKIGNKYDPSWLPQVLETIGSLPINEMRNSLESILSENLIGTVKSTPRLALLLEIPS